MGTENKIDESQLWDRSPKPAIGREVGPYYVRGLLRGAELNGYDPRTILSMAKVDPDVFGDPEARLDGEELHRLILAARKVLNDEYLGFLKIPAKLEMGYIVGHSAVECKTLGHAVRRMTNWVNAIRNDIFIEIHTNWSSETVDITYQIRGLKPEVERHILEWFCLTWAYKIKCWLIAHSIPLTQMCFSSKRPDGCLDYKRMFNCPVHFGAKKTYISFPCEYMDAPIVRTGLEFANGGAFDEEGDWFLLPEDTQSFSSRVEQLLFDMYREGYQIPTLELLSRELCCSSRTLSRRLAREDVSFQRLKDRVRCSLAKKFLEQSGWSIAQIAEKLCFSEPSDFTRAFTAWVGVTPSVYRENSRD